MLRRTLIQSIAIIPAIALGAKLSKAKTPDLPSGFFVRPAGDVPVGCTGVRQPDADRLGLLEYRVYTAPGVEAGWGCESYLQFADRPMIEIELWARKSWEIQQRIADGQHELDALREVDEGMPGGIRLVGRPMPEIGVVGGDAYAVIIASPHPRVMVSRNILEGGALGELSLHVLDENWSNSTKAAHDYLTRLYASR
jgi:hypothetical protein